MSAPSGRGYPYPNACFKGPNFIHAHPPSPENTLLGVGGIKFLPRGGSKYTPPPPSPENCLMARNGGRGGGYIILPWMFFSRILSAPTEVLGRDIRANLRLFQAALDTCLDSPFFASLSVHVCTSRFTRPRRDLSKLAHRTPPFFQVTLVKLVLPKALQNLWTP